MMKSYYSFFRAFALGIILLSTCSPQGSGWLAFADSPPSTVTLMGPPNATTVPLGSPLSVGLLFGPEYIGLLEFLDISVIYPNGTVVFAGGASNYLTISANDSAPPQDCGQLDGAGEGGVRAAGISVDQVGTYMVQYNVSYWLSSDPSQANATYCGPPPFSQQMWLLNTTFVAFQPGSATSTGLPNEVSTATIPGSPTGNVAPVTNGGGQKHSPNSSGSSLILALCLIACLLVTMF
ncbi:hypothetical protein BT96DRAFT_923266 [Gymnopus androsaceus JB14]|uniref:DM13 domain-containing protein n=1 Tax=Gymnopus androsaceus JB14 TaxID=1447944 RepID=A0A6A4HCN2_9AGAR|nr:hypothetical protein BT96DRAFT_923266 [Gymnopus androsaceus JB14]